MKGFWRAILGSIIVAIILGVPLNNWVSTMRRTIYGADHVALLSACRVMIDNRDAYIRGQKSEGQREDGSVYIDGQQLTDASIPRIVRELKPTHILLNDDCAIICIWPLPRISVIGYRTNAKERGTEKLIDGLWYYNGHLLSE